MKVKTIRMKPCRRCGSHDVPDHGRASGNYICRPCSRAAMRMKRALAGIGKPSIVTLPGEEWRPVPRAAGYEVSSLGRFRNASGREVKSHVGSSFPYPTVTLTIRKSKTLCKPVHHHVAAAFLGPLPNGMVTRHLDGDHLNSRLENLAYGTQAENVADTVRHGRAAVGELSGSALLTEEGVREIRCRWRAGAKSHALAREYGVHPRTIRDAANGVTWRHIPMEARR